METLFSPLFYSQQLLHGVEYVGELRAPLLDGRDGCHAGLPVVVLVHILGLELVPPSTELLQLLLERVHARLHVALHDLNLERKRTPKASVSRLKARYEVTACSRPDDPRPLN